MKKLFVSLYGGLIFLGVFLAFCLRALPDGKLHVFVLDIGQGDAIFIQTPGDEHILIDGGPDDTVIEKIGRVMPFYDRTIEVVILSHPHADHVNGLAEVLKRYEVKTVMMTGVPYHNPGYDALLEQISTQKIPVFFTWDGHDYQLGAVTLDLLYPFTSLQGKYLENQNNASIVLRLLYGQKKFYFSGDLEEEKEAELVESGLDLSADFLKVGHHGSKTSSTEPLLDDIKPKYAAISCGVNNKFKHPYPKTLEHLKARKIKIYRTDLDGIIEAVSDGEELEVRGFGK